MIQTSSLRPLERDTGSARSISLSRFNPPGVNSKNHANASQNGKPMAQAMTNPRTIQAGAPKDGPSWAMPNAHTAPA